MRICLNKIKITQTIILFLSIFFVCFTFAKAIDENGRVSINGTYMTHNSNGLYTVKPLVKMPNNFKLNGATPVLLVMVQNNNGNIVYESKGVHIKKEQKKLELKDILIDPKYIPNGKYDTIAILYSNSGIILATAYLGKIEGNSGASIISSTRLDDCKLDNKYFKNNNRAFICKIYGKYDKNTIVEFKILKDSNVGELVTSGNANIEIVDKGNNLIRVITDSKYPKYAGRYFASMWVKNLENKNVKPKYNFIFFIKGDWLVIDKSYIKQHDNESLEVIVDAIGNVLSDIKRGFLYKITNSFDDVCASGFIDLSALDRGLTYTENVKIKDCKDYSLSGFAFVGFDKGNPHVVYKVGKDVNDLISEYTQYLPRNVEKSGIHLNFKNYALLTIIVLAFLFLIIFKYKNKSLKFISSVFLFFLFSGVVFAHADISEQFDTINFTVSFPKTTYSIGEDISNVVITLQDITTLSKPAGASVILDSETTLVQSSYNNAVSVVTIPARSSSGVYDASFSIPGLCGTFGSGLFGLGVFTNNSCSFSQQFTIEGNPPSVVLNVFPSVVEVGNDITAQWDVDSANACIASGTWSGTKESNNGRHTETLVAESSVGTYSYVLSCSNSSGSTQSSRNISTFDCGDGICTDEAEQCGTVNSGTTCNVDCGPCAPNFKINEFKATPSLVSSGSNTTLSWSVSGANSCTMSGYGQTWMGAVKSISVGPISEETTFTLTCDTDSGQVNKTATVNVVPIWQEI